MRMEGPYLATSQAVTLGLTICAAANMEDACKRSLALREWYVRFVLSSLLANRWV